MKIWRSTLHLVDRFCRSIPVLSPPPSISLLKNTGHLWCLLICSFALCISYVIGFRGLTKLSFLAMTTRPFSLLLLGLTLPSVSLVGMRLQPGFRSFSLWVSYWARLGSDSGPYSHILHTGRQPKGREAKQAPASAKCPWNRPVAFQSPSKRCLLAASPLSPVLIALAPVTSGPCRPTFWSISHKENFFEGKSKGGSAKLIQQNYTLV